MKSDRDFVNKLKFLAVEHQRELLDNVEFLSTVCF